MLEWNCNLFGVRVDFEKKRWSFAKVVEEARGSS
jgi:hypothetical protein